MDFARLSSTMGLSSPSTAAPPPAPPQPSQNQTNVRFNHPVVLSQIREDCMAQKLHLRASEFTEVKDMNLWTGTFNVNAKKPVSVAECAKLLYWLRVNQEDKTAPDVVAVGFQEIVDLNAVNVVVNNMSGPRSSQWEESFLTALNSYVSDQAYDVIMNKHLVGILLLVFVKRVHFPFVSDVLGSTAGVGIMGMMGNKGGVAIRMKLYDSTICFVCSHLAAHTHNVMGRNSDFANIMTKIEFRDAVYDEMNPLGYPDPSAHILTIHSHDFIFWLGDLNYRLVEDSSFTVDDCFAHVEKRNLDVLLARDQLNQERDKGNVFQGFEEGKIHFLPTYKFQAGTSFYDRRPEKKIRAPAWCDRILWKAKQPETVDLRHYGAAMELDMSDHKPVAAQFRVKINYEVEEKKEVVQREINRELDKWESDNRPKISISDNNLLHFDAVSYMIPQTKSFWIENTGLVVAHFKLAPKLQDAPITKPWLTISPTYGMIAPKEKFELKLTVQVNMDAVHALSSGQDTLDETMILRIANGGDQFLVVSGDYLPSCFGCSLEQLVVQTEPVRNQTPVPREAAVSQKIPKELWRMVDALYSQGLSAPNIFLDTDESEASALRAALDTGAPFPIHRPQSMAALLVHWLQSLRESVVPESSIGPDCSARTIIDSLSTVHYNVFIYIVSFLREVLLHSARNLLNSSKLGYGVTQSPTPKIEVMERLISHFLTTGTL
ncbi:unnamed protein product [Aphanomyces euteiches]